MVVSLRKTVARLEILWSDDLISRVGVERWPWKNNSVEIILDDQSLVAYFCFLPNVFFGVF